MGLTTTTTSSTSPTPTTSPDTDNDTPPQNYHAIKPVSFSNGTLKNHHHFNHHLLLQPQSPAAVVIYKECLKNHAANLGGHALDGCGEFMPSPNSNPSDPTSLKCAACGCHRNFHRHEPESTYSSYSPPPAVIAPHFIDFRHPRRPSPSPSPSPPPPQFPKIISYAPLNDNLVVEGNCPVTTPGTPNTAKGESTLSGRKRFRSRFTTEQKEKMFVFAEKIGWKMQRCDESMVENFCNELGVTRGVFKVWVHNNKNTLGKKDTTTTTTTTDQITNTNNCTVITTATIANGISIGQEKHGGISDDGGQ